LLNRDESTIFVSNRFSLASKYAFSLLLSKDHGHPDIAQE
jgi:hypothetical protein